MSHVILLWDVFSRQMTAPAMMETPALQMHVMTLPDVSIPTSAMAVLATMGLSAPLEMLVRMVPVLEPMTTVTMGLPAQLTTVPKPQDAPARRQIRLAMTELPAPMTSVVAPRVARKHPTTALVTTEKVALRTSALRESDALTEGGITETSVMMETTARTMIPARGAHALETL
jgi:hypothetical protein